MLKVIYLQFVYFFAEIKRAIAELQLEKKRWDQRGPV